MSQQDIVVRRVHSYLRVRDANAAIAFYEKAFGAKEIFRLSDPGDRVAHAEMELGPTMIMLSDEYPEMGVMSPTSLDGTGVGIYLQVDDANAAYERAIEAGATSMMEPKDQFYGERAAKVRDPFGHEWLLGQQLEELSPVEMQERFDAMMKGQ